MGVTARSAIRAAEPFDRGFPDGRTPTPELAAATNRLKRLVSLELLGFFVIFTCMILMRFGL